MSDCPNNCGWKNPWADSGDRGAARADHVRAAGDDVAALLYVALRRHEVWECARRCGACGGAVTGPVLVSLGARYYHTWVALEAAAELDLTDEELERVCTDEVWQAEIAERLDSRGCADCGAPLRSQCGCP